MAQISKLSSTLNTISNTYVMDVVEDECSRTFIAGETIVGGAPVYIDGTTGKVYNADANASGKFDPYGIAVRGVTAGNPVTVVRKGTIGGFDFTSQNYGAPIYLSDTVGTLADTKSTTHGVLIGRVVPQYGNTRSGSLAKVLELDIKADPNGAEIGALAAENISLTQLSDVTLTSPANTEVLKFNGTTWVNAADAT